MRGNKNKNFFNLKLTRGQRKILTKLFVVIMAVSLYFAQDFSQYFQANLLQEIEPPVFDGTTYPIKQVPKWSDFTMSDFQKFKSGELNYQNVPADKLIDIPAYDTEILKNNPRTLGNKEQDLQFKNALGTYITAYLGAYTSGIEPAIETVGSHPAVDIRAYQGTPVYAIANAKVFKAKTGGTNGNYVVLKHYGIPTLDDPQTKVDLFSSYLHLEVLNVQLGEIVKKGQVIGIVGLTGLTTTYHLHFQIDQADAPYSPYWPFTWKDAQVAGLNFFEAVNVGLGKEEAAKYTVNPMDYVQKYLHYQENNTVASTENLTLEVNNNPSNPTNLNLNLEVNQNQNLTPEDSNPINTDTVIILQENQNTAPETPPNSNENLNPTDINPNSNVNLNPTSVFTDVTQSHSYFAAIQFLKANNIVSGYADGTFQPDKTVSRIEALKMLLLGFKMNLVTQSALQFSDTDNQEWYANYLQTALDLGIVRGYEDKTFRPANLINRAEYLKILLKINRIDPLPVYQAPYADVPADSWFAPYTFYSQTNNIFPANSENFEPTRSVTRGEVAESVYRMLQANLNKN